MGFVSIFVVLLIIWSIILIVLKFRYGVGRVGCAAGGGVVDVAVMHEEGLSRTKRKYRILRNWRVQTIFLMASLTIPVLSFLMANRGINPFISTLAELNAISNTVDSLAYMGLNANTKVFETHAELQRLINMKDENFCPMYKSSEWAHEKLNLHSIRRTMKSGVYDVTTWINKYSRFTNETLIDITNSAAAIESVLDWMNLNDWIIRLFLVVLNVVNVFFLLGVFLTKNAIDYVALQAMTQYFFLPLFSLVTIFAVALTSVVAVLGVMNADFCSGGAGSPAGFIQDVIVGHGHGTSSELYQAIDFYIEVGCLECHDSVICALNLTLRCFRSALPMARFQYYLIQKIT